MQTLGVWAGAGAEPAFCGDGILAAVGNPREVVHVVRDPGSGTVGVARGGHTEPAPGGAGSWPLLATLPALYPEWLGDRSFCEVHGVRFPYASGAMANGIATTGIVIAMAEAGFLSFFGAAGLGP